jgi:hypothetical protein
MDKKHTPVIGTFTIGLTLIALGMLLVYWEDIQRWARAGKEEQEKESEDEHGIL